MEIFLYVVLALVVGVLAGSVGTRKRLQRPRPPTEIHRSGTAAYQEYKRGLADE